MKAEQYFESNHLKLATSFESVSNRGCKSAFEANGSIGLVHTQRSTTSRNVTSLLHLASKLPDHGIYRYIPCPISPSAPCSNKIFFFASAATWNAIWPMSFGRVNIRAMF